MLFANLFCQHHASYFVPLNRHATSIRSLSYLSGSWSRKPELVPLQYLDSNLRNLTAVIKLLIALQQIRLDISGFHLQSELREAKDTVTGDLLGQLVGCWSISLRFSQQTYKPKPFDIGCNKETHVKKMSNIIPTSIAIHFLRVNRSLEGWLMLKCSRSSMGASGVL